MAYDFLGTMTLGQWMKLKSFCDYHIQQIGLTSESEQASPYVKHLIAEIAKANKTLQDLENVSQNYFANYSGDFSYKEELDQPESKIRYNLSDSDTSVLVSDIKKVNLPFIKRKKENIEYRIKKFRDLVDQLQIKLSHILTITDKYAGWVTAIETQFVDGLHTTNLDRSMEFPEYIEHDPNKYVRSTDSEQDP